MRSFPAALFRVSYVVFPLFDDAISRFMSTIAVYVALLLFKLLFSCPVLFFF